jgi:Ca2+-binding EF-hand superfamily protein
MKSSTLKNTVLAFGIILFMSNYSFGQPPQDSDKKKPPTFKQLLKEMDKNEDGKLSKNEVQGPLKNDFSKIDTDEDGFITEKELEKAPKPKGRERQDGK